MRYLSCGKINSKMFSLVVLVAEKNHHQHMATCKQLFEIFFLLAARFSHYESPKEAFYCLFCSLPFNLSYSNLLNYTCNE